MMIPKIIREDISNFDDGTYCKQYVVHAPEWHIYHGVDGTCDREDYSSAKVNHFIISESTRFDRLETLVFPADAEGTVLHMIEVAGGRDLTADQVLTSFALVMMEAGYDTV